MVSNGGRLALLHIEDPDDMEGSLRAPVFWKRSRDKPTIADLPGEGARMSD